MQPFDSQSPDAYERVFDELFPICRSITGPGFRESLDLMCRHVPLDVRAVPSGTKVLDWTVPQEWRIRSAKLTGPDGETVADFAESNLSVVNYSSSVDEQLSLEELLPRLHTIPAMPDAVPYVTSYYRENWGFCMTYRQKSELKPGTYHAKIDAEMVDGHLNYGVCDLPGQSQQVFLLSTYLCHPSMANNELSGPLALMGLYQRLAARRDRRFTYRFLVIPETIGSITYLSEEGKKLQEKMAGGLVLTCLGGPMEGLSYKASRRDAVGNPAVVDTLARHLNSADPEEWRFRDFTPDGGSDERQYCSPGFDLPVGQFARSVYGEYPEYHTSKDDKEFMSIDAVLRAVDALEEFIDAFEYEGMKLTNLSPYGEPQLGRRDLYPNMNSHQTRDHSSDHQVDSRAFRTFLLNILSFSDGTVTLRDIAERLGEPVTRLVPAARALESQDLLKRS